MAKPSLRFRLEEFSYRFAEQILNANLAIKQEVESILLSDAIDIPSLSRPYFNAVLRDVFVSKGWEDQPALFDEPGDPGAKMVF